MSRQRALHLPNNWLPTWPCHLNSFKPRFLPLAVCIGAHLLKLDALALE
eukprot:CAMPEP_0183354338 /NCGR_PEP_ID=MMETSP0164_2-20130417/37249_1 /TAXON_ID=221442 /ORGANISM="Coccolithus pelagicus ssp braarudi, Strain PLY182g" /LENGTH=48 /DNA_ID= /DNA_START= /DNA_END= /DNA_ORIENTATION=